MCLQARLTANHTAAPPVATYHTQSTNVVTALDHLDLGKCYKFGPDQQIA